MFSNNRNATFLLSLPFILLGISSCSFFSKDIQVTLTTSYHTTTPKYTKDYVGKPCNSHSHYTYFKEQGIIEGTKVSLFNSDNKIIGVSELDKGILVLGKRKAIGNAIEKKWIGVNCKFSLTFENTPITSFYKIEIKDETMNFSKDELVENNWKLNLKI